MIPIPPLAIYLGVCLVLGWLGRNRILGFWGNLMLAMLAPPVAALVIFAGSPRPKRPLPPVKPTVG